MNSYRYRTCRECGLIWNVSVKAENVKKYICPVCRNKEHKKTRSINNDDRKSYKTADGNVSKSTAKQLCPKACVMGIVSNLGTLRQERKAEIEE